MKSNAFDPVEFMNRLARQLVFEFDDASQAGTPGLKGGAREHSARKKLESLLPGAVAVGSGLVFDSYGNTSRQQDVVLYERNLCPVFSINDAPDATYFPCEGVIATGEIKSGLNQSALEDAFEKIASVKRLRRHAEKTFDYPGLPSAVSYRAYCSTDASAAIQEIEYNQATKESDQIFGFILCGNFSLKTDTMLERASELFRKYGSIDSPNIIISLKDGCFHPYDMSKRLILHSPLNAGSIAYCSEAEGVFSRLIQILNIWIREGRTVPVSHFNRYFFSNDPNKKRIKVDSVKSII